MVKPTATKWDLRPTQIERFHASYFMEPNSGCWIWHRLVDDGGYGLFTVAKQRLARAHRISYFVHKGEIPEGLQIDHLCRLRCCVNPHHLEPVTNRTNAKRGQAGYHIGLMTHCRNGHPYDEANTYIRERDGYRGCLICLTARNQKRKGGDFLGSVEDESPVCEANSPNSAIRSKDHG